MIVHNYLFHRVNPVKETWALAMHPKVFSDCIHYIDQNYQIIVAEEYYSNPNAFLDAKKPLATISFDDGFKDNIQYAAEILKKYKAKASFYIAVDSIENDKVIWNYLFNKCISGKGDLILNLKNNTLGNKFEKINLYHYSEKQAFGRKLYQHFKEIPFKDTLDILNQMYRQLNFNDKLQGYMMDWEDIKQLLLEGHYIGSHTMTHPFLSNLTEMEMEWEFSESKKRIKNICRVDPKIISYPVGDYSSGVETIAKKVGYQFGLAVGQRFYNSKHDASFSIPRMDIYAGDGIVKSKLRISGQLNKMKSIIGYNA